MINADSASFRQIIYNSYLLYGIRIFIALSGAVILPWWLDKFTLTIPLILGVVAAGLTDIDDRFSGRIKTILITLICFAFASFSVELLFPYPFLFTIGLLTSTFIFIFLGVLGQRYATIAFGALLIASYTMLGYHLYDRFYLQPCLLLIGALWYYIVTLISYLILPIRSIQNSLTLCFHQLGNYLTSKSMLFDPDEDVNFSQQLLDTIQRNSILVNQLNQVRALLFTRLKSDRGQRATRRTLSYYFILQDIHERASSSYADYQTICRQLKHSDILFRFQQLLNLQAKCCHQIARSIAIQQHY